MKPSNFTVAEVFQMERRYVVPLFQRPYVWSRERHWTRLWSDIMEKADEVLDHGTDPHYHLRKHFLGAAVISQIKVYGHDIAAMDVIDGQQRLTTLQVLLRAFYDFVRVGDQSQMAHKLQRATENSFVTDHQQHKVWPTSGDRKVYEKVFTAGSPDALKKFYPEVYARYARKPTPRPLLVQAYLFFYDAIAAYCLPPDNPDATETDTDTSKSDTPTESQRLDALFLATTKYLELVAIELEDGDDPQTIYETLNNLGERLTPSDLLRNFVFLEAMRQKEDVEQLYQEYWAAFDASGGHDDFWKQRQTQGRVTQPRLDLFIFHYLTSRTQREIPIKHLYAEFRDWWLKKCPVAKKGLEELHAASLRYRTFLVPDTQTRLGVFCERLRALDVGTVYPLLLMLTEPGKVPTADLPGMLSDLESYLIRRAVCGMTAKNYNNIFLALLKKLSAVQTPDRADLRDALSALQGESARWPTDKEFESAWLNSPVYGAVGAGRVNLILRALDRQMTTNKQEHLPTTETLTVEHIMPQSWSANDWPFYTGNVVNPSPTEEEEADRRRILHTFGNLTLLTQPLNSSVSNGPFAQKRPQITLHSLLCINAELQKLPPACPWNEDTIRERGEALFQIALKIWPAPEAPAQQSP